MTRDEFLAKYNLKRHQKRLWELFEKDYNGILLIIKSYSDKKFAYFIPNRFEETGKDRIKTGRQLCFYWINDDELVTCML